MTGSYNEFAERLFLQKSDLEEISVPCNDLAQHQIDGIRFLYTQYKKMKQGVIINYASGCGASAQVAIFISSIHAQLEKPLLILYDKEEEKEEWLERFSKWTTISADSIVVDPSNVFVKKLVHINNVANIEKLCGRQWSIVVVKSDEVNHKFMRYPLKASFKVWITSVDMKKDRTALNVIYAWIYDKSKAQINKYLDYNTDAKESFINSLLLDSLLEDVLLTRRDLKPFRASKRRLDPEVKLDPKISRKNKDATGMKIKRTKKNLDGPSTSIAHCTTNQPDTLTRNNIKIDNKDEETKLDVESFIRDNLPLESDSNLSMALRNLEDTSHTSLSASSKTEDTSTDSPIKFNSTVDKVDILGPNTKLSVELINDSSQESIAVGNIMEVETGISNLSNTMQIQDSSRSSLNSKSFSESSNGSSQESLAVGNEVEVGRRSILSNPILIQDSSRSSQNSHRSFLELSNGSIQESVAVCDEALEAGRYSDKSNLMPKIEEVFSFGVVKNKHSDNESNHSIVNEKNEVSSDDGNEVVVDQERKLELTTRVTQETDSSFDSKMRQMEERALKKFKGSFLDNIFKM